MTVLRYFKLFITNDIIKLVLETNRNADKCYLKFDWLNLVDFWNGLLMPLK